MRPLAKRPRQHPRRLVLVRPETAKTDLTSQQESFAAIARELPPLFERHWQELGDPKILLDPDWDRYFALEVQGFLRLTTARFNGVLVGYISNLAGPALHYKSTPHAEIEMFWLDPVYRGSWFVLRWFRANDAMLKEAGVKRVLVAVKAGYKDGRVGSVFKRLGYHMHETVYARSF